MSDPFAELADDIHAEAGFSLPALYRVQGAGAGVAVTIRRINPDSQVTYRGMDFRIDTAGLHVRCSQVADLKQGDTFALLDAEGGVETGEILTAAEDGRRDDGHHEWWVGTETAES